MHEVTICAPCYPAQEIKKGHGLVEGFSHLQGEVKWFSPGLAKFNSMLGLKLELD